VKTKESLTEILRMSIEEKIALLSDVDKAYVQGYVERAVLDYQKKQKGRQSETSQITEKQEITEAYAPEKNN